MNNIFVDINCSCFYSMRRINFELVKLTTSVHAGTASCQDPPRMRDSFSNASSRKLLWPESRSYVKLCRKHIRHWKQMRCAFDWLKIKFRSYLSSGLMNQPPSHCQPSGGLKQDFGNESWMKHNVYNDTAIIFKHVFKLNNVRKTLEIVISIKPRLHERFFRRDFSKSSAATIVQPPSSARSDDQKKSSKLIVIISTSWIFFQQVDTRFYHVQPPQLNNTTRQTRFF